MFILRSLEVLEEKAYWNWVCQAFQISPWTDRRSSCELCLPFCHVSCVLLDFFIINSVWLKPFHLRSCLEYDIMRSNSVNVCCNIGNFSFTFLWLSEICFFPSRIRSKKAFKFDLFHLYFTIFWTCLMITFTKSW